MYRIFKIVLLVGSGSLACSQSVGALYLGHGVPAVEIAVEYKLEEFNQQVDFQKSTNERIDRKYHHLLTMSTEEDPVKKVLPFPYPRPIPVSPRLFVG